MQLQYYPLKNDWYHQQKSDTNTISFMYKRNKKGPSIELCCTPHLTVNMLNLVFPINLHILFSII